MSKKHGHHGGAWKVAYADFVTAMMALFIVLWLTAQDVKVKEAIERSFKRAGVSVTKEGGSIIPGNARAAVKTRSLQENKGGASSKEMEMLRRLSEDLIKVFQSNPDSNENDSVKMELTPEGLHISIYDRTRKPIFEGETEQFTPFGSWVFSTLAWEISRYNTFPIELGGHSERGHKSLSDDYSAWELTAARANAARRLINKHGVAPRQIHRVSGFADTFLQPNRPPEDPSNRRVTVLLRVQSANDLL